MISQSYYLPWYISIVGPDPCMRLGRTEPRDEAQVDNPTECLIVAKEGHMPSSPSTSCIYVLLHRSNIGGNVANGRRSVCWMDLWVMVARRVERRVKAREVE